MDNKFFDPTTNHHLQYIPDLHLPTIKQLLNQPLLTLDTEHSSLKNHLVSNKTLNQTTKHLLFEYKYGELLNLNQTTHPHQNTKQHKKKQCTIKTNIITN